MGYYIEVPVCKGKAKLISEKVPEAKIISRQEAETAILDPSNGIIVVIHNRLFEAAGFAFDKSEFKAFTSDSRQKEYILMPRKKAEELSNYVK